MASNLNRALAVYHHLSVKFDRFFETGWRRCYGWLGLIVGYYSYVHAPAHGIDVNYDAVNFFLGTIVVAFVTRGAEKVLKDRNPLNLPGGGLVNNAAIA